MQIHSLELTDDYSLIGIHTSEEDYRLAFLLNTQLHTRFVKHKHNLDFKNSPASFSIFNFNDEKNQISNYLISNKFIGADNTKNREPNLFSNSASVSNISYLIPEKKNVDFFLKIDGDITGEELNTTITKINNINQIITSYKVCPSNLKSKDFLIF